MNFMQSSIDKWIPSKTAPAADSPDTDTNDTDDTVETDKMETETEIEAVKLSRFPFGETSLDFLSVLCQYLSPLDILALKAASSSLRRVMQGSIFLGTVYTMPLYVLYTVYCELYTVYCILYTIYCILYTVYCILYTVCCILYTIPPLTPHSNPPSSS
ncbi:hypothetical protein B484DRAFT_136636 [Ochromonadaceae sp. CCMP2298]|nr:hypothetical protein B484DRAFT_137619 [Ochromonadaceae sp. CCMP2298]KAJ1419418.1 hypothetical protein B484DRAFT_136636 [Ochromonadaceae sp. CCMP2298]